MVQPGTAAPGPALGAAETADDRGGAEKNGAGVGIGCFEIWPEMRLDLELLLLAAVFK